ncbi:kynureninase [Marinoscillum sp. MHG1-6]|uniref:kynureninase n=1 Tax=Marinoscillum sp. MHG1-6 TaxID=2959627 RepID=UPI0021572D1B|nr:kynureninase [Marinoscillum sp. MHG1-6]
MQYKGDLDFAKALDRNDELRSFRHEFHFPQRNGRDAIYLCGNSLGLQPKNTRDYLEKELKSWQENAVEGHFSGSHPWVSYHEHTKETLAALVGAKTTEVVSMNNLTTNLHLMLASFYQPNGVRRKILIEGGAFPSDHYAAESHMRRMGVDPDENLICLKPRQGELYTTEEIVQAIKEAGDSLSLVLLPGIQYYTGQSFDLKAISEAAHSVGAFAGFDHAHAIGNIPMNLHEDDVDFAVWCTYKYLNSGPGSVSGIFVHEKHSADPNFPKLTGWWGHEPKTRFEMNNHFKPALGADAWMLSNMNILSMAAHRASLDVFARAGIQKLRDKSLQLTGFLEFLLKSDPVVSERIKILTPTDPEQRGCQLSIFLTQDGKEIFEQLIEKGVILDWREPNVIRVAPTPLYNRFEDVWDFYSILRGIFAC